jgi:hypothetical protein
MLDVSQIQYLTADVYCTTHVLFCRHLQVNHKSWLSDPLEQLDAEAVEKEVQASYKVLYKMNKVRGMHSCVLQEISTSQTFQLLEAFTGYRLARRCPKPCTS